MDKAVFSPRANIRYNPTQDVNIRFSYAEGFRAPQAFDEDLHISNVGGELVSIVRAKGLKEPGINTAEQQVEIAKEKAGIIDIQDDFERVIIERFEVERHQTDIVF